MVHYERSPTYCDAVPELGIPGTSGRVCNSTSTNIDSCSALCCGRGYFIKKVRRVEKCNCTFHWCCYVVCDTCEYDEWVTVCKWRDEKMVIYFVQFIYLSIINICKYWFIWLCIYFCFFIDFWWDATVVKLIYNLLVISPFYCPYYLNIEIIQQTLKQTESSGQSYFLMFIYILYWLIYQLKHNYGWSSLAKRFH